MLHELVDFAGIEPDPAVLGAALHLDAVKGLGLQAGPALGTAEVVGLPLRGHLVLVAGYFDVGRHNSNRR